ncbi:MAG: FkbM family methyltransferase [Maritimibacter sp.]
MTPKVQRILKQLEFGRPFKLSDATLIHTKVHDQRVTFVTNMERDPIQRNHRNGRFYEQQELDELRAIFPEGGTFVDIGANVGNHSIYAGLFLKAGKVIPFEPNPLAYRVLVHNVLLNGLDEVVDLSNLGVGVSDHAQEGFAMEKRDRNLGGAKMIEGKGDLMVFPADDLLEGEAPAMIKIDVEGMEMQALGGLEKTITEHRPVLLVEVDNENEEDFMIWAEVHDYEVAQTIQRYRLNKNHLLMPRQVAKSGKPGVTLKTGTTASKGKGASSQATSGASNSSKSKSAGSKSTGTKTASSKAKLKVVEPAK